MINHVCEKHTHQAFICLSCKRVLSIKKKKVDRNLHAQVLQKQKLNKNIFQHFINCLQCTEEGLSTIDVRRFSISKQIKGWSKELVKHMVKEGKAKEVKKDSAQKEASLEAEKDDSNSESDSEVSSGEE